MFQEALFQTFLQHFLIHFQSELLIHKNHIPSHRYNIRKYPHST